MGFAPLLMMGAGALGGLFGRKKKGPGLLKGRAGRAAQQALDAAKQGEAAPAPPPPQQQTTSASTQIAQQQAMKRRRKASAGSGRIVPAGGRGGAPTAGLSLAATSLIGG